MATLGFKRGLRLHNERVPISSTSRIYMIKKKHNVYIVVQQVVALQRNTFIKYTSLPLCNTMSVQIISTYIRTVYNLFKTSHYTSSVYYCIHLQVDPFRF